MPDLPLPDRDPESRTEWWRIIRIAVIVHLLWLVPFMLYEVHSTPLLCGSGEDGLLMPSTPCPAPNLFEQFFPFVGLIAGTLVALWLLELGPAERPRISLVVGYFVPLVTGIVVGPVMFYVYLFWIA